MATHAVPLLRPAPTADYAAPSRFRPLGFAIGLGGLALVTATLIANIVAAGDSGADRADTLAWSFGLTTTGLATLKLGIATVLIGILIRLWMRVDSVKEALPHLRPAAEPEQEVRYGDIDTPFGRATATRHALGPLVIHRMARAFWAPMLAMGAMAVLGGLVLSFVQAGTDDVSDFTTLSAWVQGLQFFGEGLVLAGISFLLGSILAALRSGGGEVQESLRVAVKTLRMPPTVKAFIALMALGTMAAMAQFGLYVVAAHADVDTAVWFAWLGPFREFSLGLLLAGIVLALYSIGTVLGFQFHRIREIILTGR